MASQNERGSEDAGSQVPRLALVAGKPEPRYGTRADSPGPRGCWATKRDGTPCGAARRADGDFCNAHSGLGVAEDPAKYAPLAQRASAENRRRRAALRLELGITRPSSLRSLLKASVFAERERVVAAAMSPLSDPDASSSLRSKTALALLDAVDPPMQASVEVPFDAQGIEALSLSQLRQLAQQAQG